MCGKMRLSLQLVMVTK